MWTGAILGIAVAALNGLGAWLIMRWALNKDSLTFMKFTLGGMVGRFLLVGALSALLLIYITMHKGFYVGGLMITYVIFQSLEVRLLLKKKKRKEPAEEADR